MRATDKAGNVTNGISITSKVEVEGVTLGTVSGDTIIVSSNVSTPTNGNVTITINYADNGLTKQYKKGADSTWTNVTGTTTNITIDKNMGIAVRYTDGTNYFNGTSYNVQNIDKQAPNTFTPTITGTSNMVRVVATTTDKTATSEYSQSGIEGYRFSIDNGTTWTSYMATGDKQYTGLMQNTNYTVLVQAKDKAGNVTQSSISRKTELLPSNSLTLSKSAWSNGNAKVTVTTNQSLYKIQYQIGGTSGTWTTASAVGGNLVTGNMTSGQTVYARVWDGNNASGTQQLTITQTSKMLLSNGPTYAAGTTSTNMAAFNGWNAFLNYDITPGSYKINSTSVTGGGYIYIPNIDLTNIDYISMTAGGFRNLSVYIDDNNTSTRLMQMDFVNPNGTEWYQVTNKKVITGVTGTHNLKIYAKCPSNTTNINYLYDFYVYYK